MTVIRSTPAWTRTCDGARADPVAQVPGRPLRRGIAGALPVPPRRSRTASLADSMRDPWAKTMIPALSSVSRLEHEPGAAVDIGPHVVQLLGLARQLIVHEVAHGEECHHLRPADDRQVPAVVGSASAPWPPRWWPARRWWRGRVLITLETGVRSGSEPFRGRPAS